MGLIIWMFWLIILNKVNSQAGSECRTCSGVSSLWCYYFYFHRCGFVLLLCFLLFTAAFICFLLCVFIFSSRVNPVSWAQRKLMSKLLPTRPKPLNLREAPQPAIMKTSGWKSRARCEFSSFLPEVLLPLHLLSRTSVKSVSWTQRRGCSSHELDVQQGQFTACLLISSTAGMVQDFLSVKENF